MKSLLDPPRHLELKTYSHNNQLKFRKEPRPFYTVRIKYLHRIWACCEQISERTKCQYSPSLNMLKQQEILLIYKPDKKVASSIKCRKCSVFLNLQYCTCINNAHGYDLSRYRHVLSSFKKYVYTVYTNSYYLRKEYFCFCRVIKTVRTKELYHNNYGAGKVNQALIYN